MPGKGMAGYYAAAVLCNLLSEGKSALLHANLVEKETLYTKINAYTTESLDPGLLVISGSLVSKVAFEEAESALITVLQQIKATTPVALEKAKNQMEAQLVFGQVNLVDRAQELAIATLQGDTNLVNNHIDYIRQVDLATIQAIAETILQEHNCTTLHYQTMTQS